MLKFFSESDRKQPDNPGIKVADHYQPVEGKVDVMPGDLFIKI